MTTVTTTHVLESTPPHYAWDNRLSPKLSIHSGDVVTFETRGCFRRPVSRRLYAAW